MDHARLRRGVGGVAHDDVVAHGTVPRVGQLVDVPELPRLAREAVVLLEPAGHGPGGAGHLAVGREVDGGRSLDEPALLGRELEPVDERARRRERTARDPLGPREAHGLAEAEEELGVRLVAAGDPPGLLPVHALRELAALVGERAVGVHRAHRARELAHPEREWDGEPLELRARELAVREREPERMSAEGPPRLAARE